MDDIFGFGLFITVVLIIGSSIMWHMVTERHRRRKIGEFADETGLAHLPDGSHDLTQRFSQFKLFQTGTGRKISNVIEGDSGDVAIAIFDYKYTTGSGDNKSNNVQSVISLTSPHIQCPEFRLRPESLFDKVGSALGFQNIDFESHPLFSKMFVLQGPDETTIREFFRPTLLELLQQKKGLCLEAQGDTLFFYKSRVRIPPAKLKEALAEAYEIYGVLTEGIA